MSDLPEFLLARIADDEREWGNGAFAPVAGQGLSRLILKTRAECEAKRRIVELADAAANPDLDPVAEHHAGNDGPWVGSVTLKLLALPYADHPDYDEAWRP